MIETCNATNAGNLTVYYIPCCILAALHIVERYITETSNTTIP